MKPIKKAIILCWIMLFACFLIKIFGGNWFEVICTNEHFIKACDFIDNRIVIKYIIAFIIYIPSTYFLMLSMCLLPNPNKFEKTIILSTMILIWFSQFISEYLKFFLEICMFISLPMFIWRKRIYKAWYYGILGFIMNFLFQILSLLTRNIGIQIVDDSTLLSLILMIDYYIMIALYYLYIKLFRKEKSNGYVRNSVFQRTGNSA